MGLKPRTVLIGLDGATFTILDPLMRDGVMPFLSSFAGGGVRADLLSVVPPLTPPAWTSLATGRSPGRHGVLDFFLKEDRSAHIRLASSRDIACETIWSMANRQGLRVTALNFPVMLPPPPVQGSVIGGWVPWRQLRLACHPPDLFDRLKALPGFNARELAMDMADEGKAIEGCRPEDYEEWILLHIRRERQWLGILEYLVGRDPCPLTAILFDGPDKILHLCWRFLDPRRPAATLSPWEDRIRRLCLDYFRGLDAVLAGVADLAGPDASLVMASDHGFGAQTETFYVNAWLEQNGYLAWADPAAHAGDGSTLGLGQLARHVYQMDWSRTLAYAATPSSNGIHIVAAEDGRPGGVPATRYEAFRRELVEGLSRLRSAVTDEPLVSRVWTREEAFAGPYLQRAPDLTLALRDGGLVSILASDTVVRRRAEPAGTHRPEGVFLARGPGIRAGLRLPALSILDVAPLLLYTMEVDVPSDLEGRMPEEVFHTEIVRRRPVRLGQPAEAPAKPVTGASAEPVLDAEAEAKLAARLRALGYME